MEPRVGNARGATPGTEQLEQLESVYRVRTECRLGDGADGRVYRADLRPGRPDAGARHAVKVWRREAYDPSREIEVLRRLQPHPHILELLGVFDSSEFGPRSAMATPELDMDLHTLLARRPQGLNLSTATSLCRQLLRALAHMHGLRVVHRDLKPANLLLRVGGAEGEGDDTQLVVADFSRAREMPSVLPRRARDKRTLDSARGQLTVRQGLTPGLCTPTYAAPEVDFGPWEGQCWQGPSADVWSFGCIAFQTRCVTPFAQGPSEAARWASVLCRLGDPPTGLELGPRQGIILQAAQKRVPESQDAVGALASFADSLGALFPSVEESCRWCPEARATAAGLLRRIDAQERPAPAARPASAASQERPAPAASQERPAPAVSQERSAPAASRGEAAGAAAVAHSATQGGAAGSGAAKQERRTPDVGGTQQIFQTVFCTPTVSMHKRPGGCDCRGHCNQPGHRYHNGCDSPDVVVGGRHCLGCKCSVRMCVRPRHKSDFCMVHKRVWEALPLSLQATRACREHWHALIPGDVLAYEELWPAVRHHPLLALVGALLKEPTAVMAWLGSDLFELCRHAGSTPRPCRDAGSPPSAEAVRDSLSRVLEAIELCPNQEEVNQLARKGVARFTGPARACAYAGVIEPVGEGDKADHCLGKTHRGYKKKEDMATLQGLLEACVGLMPTWQRVLTSADLIEVVDAAQHLMASLCASCPGTIPAKGEDGSYVRPWLVRRIVLARLMHPEEAPYRVDWSAVSVEQLNRMVPDRGGALTEFPPQWSAQEIGDFLLDQPGAVAFASMLACLWSDAVAGRDGDEVLSAIESSEFPRVLSSLRRSLGTPAHPKNVLDAMLGPIRSKRQRT